MRYFSWQRRRSSSQSGSVGLTAPKGWEVVRPDDELVDATRNDDLEALANAVREAGRAERGVAREPEPAPAEGGRRGHLRVLPSPDA